VKGEVRQLQLKYMLLYNFNATCFGLSTKSHYQSKSGIPSERRHV